MSTILCIFLLFINDLELNFKIGLGILLLLSHSPPFLKNKPYNKSIFVRLSLFVPNNFIIATLLTSKFFDNWLVASLFYLPSFVYGKSSYLILQIEICYQSGRISLPTQFSKLYCFSFSIRQISLNQSFSQLFYR